MYYSLIPVPIYLVLIGYYMLARNRNDLKRTTVIQPALTLLGNLALAFYPIDRKKYEAIRAQIREREGGN